MPHAINGRQIFEQMPGGWPKTSEEIIGLFKALHAEGQTIIIVTHEEDIAGQADRIVRLRDGRILSDSATREDPIHREYLARAAQLAVEVADNPHRTYGTHRTYAGAPVAEAKP